MLSSRVGPVIGIALIRARCSADRGAGPIDLITTARDLDSFSRTAQAKPECETRSIHPPASVIEKALHANTITITITITKSERKDLRCAPESRRQILSCEAAVTAQSAGRGSSPCMQSQAVQSDAHFRAHRRRHFEAADLRMCGVLLRTSDILLRCVTSASDFAFSSPLLCNAMDRCLSPGVFRARFHGWRGEPQRRESSRRESAPRNSARATTTS